MGSWLLGNLRSSGKLNKCEVSNIYSNYTWIAKHTNWMYTCLYQSWTLCWYLYVYSFMNVSWWKHSRMSPKVKQTTLWNQSIKYKLFWSSKNGLERRVYHQYQVYPCVFYIKDSVILNHVDYCVIVSHQNYTITSLIESLNNGPENHV